MKDGKPRWYDWLDFPGPDSLTGLVVTVLVIVGLVLLVWLGIPALLALVDLVVVLGAAVSGVVARVVFRRPWTVEARSETGEILEARVVGWRKAGATVKQIARNIEFGLPYNREGLGSS